MMRISSIIITLAAIAMLTACDKRLRPEPLSFNVTTASTTYHVGDTVNFHFTGNPDIITFYSGEPGYNYAYRSRASADGTPELQFTSYAQYGTQQNTLALLVSTDFDGVYDSADIYKATWTNITSKATLSTGADNTSSGAIDLSEFDHAGTPIYFAFKYVGAAGSVQKTWTIKNFIMTLVQPDNSVSTIADIVSAGWKAVDLKNTAKHWTTSSTQLQMAGGDATAADNEDWLITTALDLNKVAPDVGVPIKDITQMVNDYSYVYANPGTYKVVFMAVNATADDEATVIKEIELTVQ